MELEKYVGKKITSSDNQSIREWYVANVNDIPNQLDESEKMEDQARQAFQLRNKFKREARIAMSDEKTADLLERLYPIPSFEELVQKKMLEKRMSRADAVADILATSSKTNIIVNEKFGL